MVVEEVDFGAQADEGERHHDRIRAHLLKAEHHPPGSKEIEKAQDILYSVKRHGAAPSFSILWTTKQFQTSTAFASPVFVSVGSQVHIARASRGWSRRYLASRGGCVV
jgi:hypothetical protein